MRIVRAILGAGCILVLVAVVSACGLGVTSCPASGWFNTVEVTVTGDARDLSDVALVRTCGGARCTPPTPSDPPLVPLEVAPEPSPTPVPGGAVWRTTADSGIQTVGRVAVYDREDRLLLSRPVALHWVRDEQGDQDERSGGPSTAAVSVGLAR
ncbi:hypothetical protein [Curtobacterium flaccumfaciens]|uniref:hypothetical protein n=1 Tax=Curtobacterium flaccumfaciens TaxID=2035 RepID=UPI00387A185E